MRGGRGMEDPRNRIQEWLKRFTAGHEATIDMDAETGKTGDGVVCRTCGGDWPCARLYVDAAIRRVLRLHKPGAYCEECNRRYPCPTLRAIAEGLGIESEEPEQ
jgi:hypothetical protein